MDEQQLSHMYDHIVQLTEYAGRSEANQERIMERLDRMNGTVVDHERRIARGESVDKLWKWLWSGLTGLIALSAIGVAAATIAFR